MNHAIIKDIDLLKTDELISRIRVNFKGCPLNCEFCFNPEGISNKIEVVVDLLKCTSCGECVSECSNSAIHSYDKYFLTKIEKCDLCGDCIDSCSSQSRKYSGKNISIDEIIKNISHLSKNQNSTKKEIMCSGGEPFMQPDILHKILNYAKTNSFHTIVETCGSTKIDDLIRMSNLIDDFYFNLRFLDDRKFSKNGQIPNKIVSDNIKSISKLFKSVYIKYSLIKNINDSEKEFDEISELIIKNNIKGIILNPIDNNEKEKYLSIKKNNMAIFDNYDREEQLRNEEKFSKKGIKVIKEYQ